MGSSPYDVDGARHGGAVSTEGTRFGPDPRSEPRFRGAGPLDRQGRFDGVLLGRRQRIERARLGEVGVPGGTGGVGIGWHTAWVVVAEDAGRGDRVAQP